MQKDNSLVDIAPGFQYRDNADITQTYLIYKVFSRQSKEQQWFLYKFSYALSDKVHVYAPFVGHLPVCMKALYPYADIWKTDTQLIMTGPDHEQIIVCHNYPASQSE